MIQTLEEIILDEEPIYLFTADVTLLYTNISHQDALSATRWALRKYSGLKCKQRKYLLDCLEYSLSHNYFWYDHNYFRQIQGVAMGAKYAPSVANLHVAQWEDESIYKNRPNQLIIYQRYIDDIFMIWKGDKESLILFGQDLEMNEKNIQLSWEINESRINFLDLEIWYKEKRTKTFLKTVDRNSYLPMDSYHHSSWLMNIPKGQLVRLRRNCTTESDYRQHAKFVGERFLDKGYEKSFL